MSRQLFRANPEFKLLDKYSTIIAKKLFRLHPTWPLFARVESGYRSPDKYHLEVWLPSPIDKDEYFLTISTADNRITVYFDKHHTHFGGFAGNTPDDAFGGLTSFLEAFFDEELTLCIRMGDDREREKSWFVESLFVDELSPDEVTYTRSWLGTYDREFE